MGKLRVKKVRMLLGDWVPPSEKASESDVELPEANQVRLHKSIDHDKVTLCGITYQKCGGGRRVIRKQKGGY